MFIERIKFINNPASITAKSGQKHEKTLYELTVYDDSVEMESAEWIQLLRPAENSSVDRLVEDIIDDMGLNGFTAVYEKKAA